jgi:RNA polymerase sigma-70 factor, ECF subfamily
MDEERTWVKQVLAGDQAAFARLVEAYQTPVFNLAYRMLGDRTEAEDAAQETFVRMYTRLSSYDPNQKLSSWVLSIASHYCIDRLRRRRFGMTSLDDLLPWCNLEPEDPADAPEKTALDREEEDMLRDLLQDMPAQYRAAIVLRYWQELSYEDMANVLHTSEGAVKARLHRARTLLAERIKTREEQPAVAGRPSRVHSQVSLRA